ncbi:NlpC/P60 family protein [Ornithinimicrobium sp. W1679]|uniref:C40 family peptidase n=1 Tax=Ornithinimicrobium sp. W1679 TaxID=3418770 RepID=UPI003CEF803E
MTTRTRSLSRTLIAVTAATAPVVALAPTAQAAPAPQVPRTPLPPALPTTPLPTVPLTPSTDDPATVARWVSVPVANVRSGPSLSNGVVTTKTLGTAVSGTLTSNGWLRISSTQYMHPSVLTSTDPTPTTSSSSSVTMYMAAAIGNVRSGPGLGYPVVATMRQGAEVRGSWTNGWLNLGNGRFVSGTILTAQGPSAPAEPVSSTQVTRWVSVPAANVRSGPSTSYSIVGARTQGAEVTGTLASNGWLRMSSTQYMAPSVLTDRDPGGAPAPAPAPAETVTQYVTAAIGNVRSGPGLNYSVVTTMRQGTEVRGSWTNGWLDLGNGRFISGTILTSTAPSASTPAPAPAPAPSTPIRSALMDTAADYVGYPYVLYGTPPNAFDCSSYTWWVYKQNGISIPRTVRDQRTVVTPVTDPQPGDLVFYNNFYHVGIYAGNGMIYEAMNPSTGVIYHKMWDHDVWYGRVPGV